MLCDEEPVILYLLLKIILFLKVNKLIWTANLCCVFYDHYPRSCFRPFIVIYTISANKFSCLSSSKHPSFWHSATSNSILDKAIDSEEARHNDFLRLVMDHFRISNILTSVVFSDYLLGLNLHGIFLAGSCWRLPWTFCENKNILFDCCRNLGCWILCQSGWRCSCQSRCKL